MVLSKFDSLSVRPPTPPKDLEDALPDADETLQFLDDPFGEKPTLPKLASTKALLNTPEQSPSSDISIPSSSGSRAKRVNFELQTCAIPRTKAIAHAWSPQRSSPLRPLPQTRVSMPLKSILKPSEDTPTPSSSNEAAAAHKFKTFAEMLDSIVQLLASSERSSRLDAYHSLQRTMQAYDKVPDHQALKHKMSLLTQFIRRDIQAPSLSGTGLDSQLIAQAMKLLMALFRISDLTSSMDEDFCSFILDRITLVASDSSMPKAVVNIHLAVLMQQNFRPRSMTTTRLDKILELLDTIHERVSGFSVQAYRIRIYRKLIQQRPDIMIKNTERWFKHIVKALVSGQKDINQSALDTALSAAKTIGHDHHVAKSVLSVLNRVRGDGDTIAGIMAQELEKMLSGDNAVLVPQIWAAVTALLRDSLNGQKFLALKSWLEIFEKCLRCEKDSVKVHANVAFCFLLYAVNLAPNTAEGWAKMFLNIPLHQLQRRIPAKKAERDAITSGYVTLLYYAFRPTASFEQLDRYWSEFVVRFWSPLIQSSSAQQAVAACRIVSALLNGSRKPWNDQRALDLRPQYMIQRSELALLDPKWVRKSLPLVLEFVETLLDITPWPENEQQGDEPVRLMWLAVVDSLVEASSKEIMASGETKDAIAHVMKMLRRLWDRHTAKLALPQQKEDLWADKFCFLIQTIIEKLGAFRFADRCLAQNGDDGFGIASTPSQRSKNQSARISPLLYLIDLLVNQSEGRLADSVRLRALKLIIEPCFHAQNTRLSRLELLRDCASTMKESSKASTTFSFWAEVATLLEHVLQEHTADSDVRGSRTFGKEYELVVDLISLGSTYMLSTARGREILSMFVNMVRGEAGEGALIIAVIEKISENVLKRTVDANKASCLSYASVLLRNLPHQMSRRVLDQGRQILWPSSPAAGRKPDFDPYNHLYGAIVSTGCAAYQKLSSLDVEPTKTFIAAVSSSIHHCQTSHLAVYLRKCQDMIRMWIEDPEQKMQSKEQSLKSLHTEVINLWKEICRAIERLPRIDSHILLYLEPLIRAGFVSRRRGVVNISITFWNNTFGKQETLQYPALLEKALRSLYNTVELSLPAWEIRANDKDNEPSFYDSDASVEDVEHIVRTTRSKESPFKISKTARRSTSRSPAVSSKGSRRKSTRPASKARLRHDDSQIIFEPIASSPLNPFNQESQVLTERQRETVERQKASVTLFADMSADGFQPEPIPSPTEIHSDLLHVDDLPNRPTRTTPSKALGAVGPMDVFLGSSPTPHARRSARHIPSDNTSVATPTAIRTRQLVDNDDLTSSPSRSEKMASYNFRKPRRNTRQSSSFESGPPENQHFISFDEGTTIDEASLSGREMVEPEGTNDLTDIILSEQQSPNVDFQLTAQIDADMQAHTATAQPANEETTESNNFFMDAASHQTTSHVIHSHDGNEKEVEDSQIPIHYPTVNSDLDLDIDTSDTSCVGDSFIIPEAHAETPNTQALRRSTRRSAVSSPILSTGGKDRKQTPAKQHNKTTVDMDKDTSSVQPDEETIFDNIVVAAQKSRDRGKKRKSMSSTQSPTSDRIVIPETHQKRGTRRSQSLLNQVENSPDVLVEDTPAPKRAKQGAGQDVSAAKNNPLLQASRTTRLSHVQVTPKRSPGVESVSEMASSPAVENAILHTAQDSEVLASDAMTTEKPFDGESQSRSAPVGASTPSRSFTERVILTPRSIINQLRSLKDYLFSAPQLVLGREEEREIDDALFDIRRQVHAAGQRNEDTNRG